MLTLLNNNIRTRKTYLCLALKIHISKRFGGGTGRGVGHGQKILRDLEAHAKKASVIANTFQEASNTKPCLEKTKPTTLSETDVFTNAKPSFKETLVNLGARALQIIPTPHNTSVKPEHVRQNKEIILNNLDYFNIVPFDKTKDNEHLLLYLRELLMKDPQSVLLRQGQVVQEILFNKRPFEEELVRELFSAFEIIDVIGKNKGFMDASTLYSILAANYLYDSFDFLKAVDPRIIYCGCVYPLTGLTKTQEDFISQSKAATGNTICDASLATRNFDFKALPSPTNNYIVLCNYESFNVHGDVIRAQNALNSYLKKIPEADRTIFQQKLLVLFNTLKDAPLDTLQKQMILNEFVIKALPIMKITDRASLIFPVTTSVFKSNPVYDDTVKQIEIPLKRSSIESSETKKAIMGVVSTWDVSKKNKFAEATFTENEEIDS